MGLLVRGKIIEVPGLTVISPASHGGPEWAKLSPGDYRPRPSENWVQYLVAHTTKGMHPQHVKRGRGPDNREHWVADFWRNDPQHSAAQLVIGSNGIVVCLCDLALVAAFHATIANYRSVGVELYQEGDGGIFEAVFDAADLLFPALCNIFEIPHQVPGAPYKNKPIARLESGGADYVGIIGHRDNTDRRGAGDPGDIFFDRQVARGAERFDIAARQDLAKWTLRQQWLNAQRPAQVRSATGGKLLAVDGIAGPRTMRAVKAAGFSRGADIPI